jgi:hypothetical protein
MKMVILDAVGQMRFSWYNEHAISHFLHPLHFESSRAIQIGSFFCFKSWTSQKYRDFFVRFLLDLSVMAGDGNLFKPSVSEYTHGEKACCGISGYSQLDA